MLYNGMNGKHFLSLWHPVKKKSELKKNWQEAD